MILDISALIAIKIGPRQTNLSGQDRFALVILQNHLAKVQVVVHGVTNFKYRQQSVLFAMGTLPHDTASLGSIWVATFPTTTVDDSWQASVQANDQWAAAKG